jgi:hypothetical protein
MDDASAKKWKARIAESKKVTEKFLKTWQENVDYRVGKPFATASDEDRVAVNPDWPNTKAKQAQLFSQVPELRLSPKLKDVPTLATAVAPFASELNDQFKRAGIATAMHECMADLINASALAVTFTHYAEKRTTTKLSVEPREAYSMLDDEEFQVAIDDDLIPTQAVPKVTDKRYRIERVSPGDALWSKTFKGSDFEMSPWVGHKGRLTWAEAKGRFELGDEMREDAIGGIPNQRETLASIHDETTVDDAQVEFVELFYRRHVYHPEETSYDAIQRVVFIEGIDQPVINRPWEGQRYSEETGKYVGSCRYPLQFCTLAYVSDMAVPPSDTEIGRPQVDELISSRTQMIHQRRHSQPLRWLNTNLIDPLIQDAVQRGVYQGFIPVNGDGSRAIGEVARANYPRENFDFDRVAKDDLREAWQIGSNQLGSDSSGETSASEANIIQSNFQTRIGYERSLVAKFVVAQAEVLAGLLALYGDFTVPEVAPDDMVRLQGWDRTQIANHFVYTIRPDSTVLQDATQRTAQLNKLLSNTAPSGFVDVEPLLREMYELNGLDPDKLVRRPPPKGIDPANLSFRFGGADDLLNPLVVAVMLAAGIAPTVEQLEAAKGMIMASMTPVSGAPMPSGGSPPTEAEKEPIPGKDTKDAGWDMMPRINTRRAEGETGEAE